MIVLAYGMPGAGKSTLLHDLVRAQAAAHRFFVLAHSLEWHPDAAHWRGAPPAGLRVVTGEEEYEAFTKEETVPEVGVTVFINVEADAVVEEVVRRGFTTYVDDEIDLIARRKGWEESPLRAIVHQGRHLENGEGEYTECHVFGACRRPQNLHTDLTDLADEFYVFRLKGSNTRKRLMDDALLEDEAEWERLRELPNFHFKYVGLKGHEWLTIQPLGKKAPQVAPRPAEEKRTA